MSTEVEVKEDKPEILDNPEVIEEAKTPPPPPVDTPVGAPPVVVAPEAAKEEPKPKRRPIRTFVKACFSFVFFPFRKRAAIPLDSATVFSAQSGFFLWLLVFGGFLLSILTRINPGFASTAGWSYIWILGIIISAIIYDINAKKFALLMLVFGCCWFGLKYVEHVQHIAIIGAIGQHFHSLDPKLDPGLASVISWVFLTPFLYAVFHLFANGRKRFSPNEIGEFHFLDGHELSDRQGLRFRTKYRDLFETLLTFGGGDIVAMDNHQQEIKRYPNVLFLYFIWPRLERIIEQRAVVEDEEKRVPRE